LEGLSGAGEPGSSNRDTLVPDMTKLLGFIGSSIGGAVGWAAGSGLGTMTAFMLCVIGTAAGLYAGRRAAQALET
jgi:outer membrane lipoprotein SlyB